MRPESAKSAADLRASISTAASASDRAEAGVALALFGALCSRDVIAHHGRVAKPRGLSLGKVTHREFAMAAGEMTSLDFVSFLSSSLRPGAVRCRDGAIAFVCMDWRHMRELLEAGAAVFDELKNLCVWNKTNGGMGSFYRSKHELVFVYKVGTAPHVNTFGLGDTGRYRTNVWDYAGISSISDNRAEELEMHPTVKPVALVADAIRDCSHRGNIVLDMFGGSGTTLIAAEKVGRDARLIEFDPVYCDTIATRYQRFTGKSAILQETGMSFDDVCLERASEGEE